MPRALWGVHPPEDSINITKRTVEGCVHFGARTVRKTLNATKRTLQTALWKAARFGARIL